MLDGLFILTPPPSRPTETSKLSIVGKGGFQILAMAFGR